MNAATVGPALSPWAPTVAAILGGDPGDRRHVAELLATGGFAPYAHDDLHAPLGAKPNTLVVLLGRAKAPERIRDLRTVAEANTKARIVASMPTDAPNASLRRALLAGAAGVVLAADPPRAAGGTRHPPPPPPPGLWGPGATPCSPASWPCRARSCARSLRVRSPIARSRSSASWSSASPTARSRTSSTWPRAR